MNDMGIDLYQIKGFLFFFFWMRNQGRIWYTEWELQ